MLDFFGFQLRFEGDGNNQQSLMMRKAIGVLFFGIFLLGGAYTGYLVITQLPMALASHDWPTVEGVVTESEVRRRKGRKKHRFTYSYEVNHQFFDSKRITFMGKVFRASAQTLVDKYPEGSKIGVHYAPDHPQISVLETGVWWIGFVVASAVAVVFLLFGVFGFRATLR